MGAVAPKKKPPKVLDNFHWNSSYEFKTYRAPLEAAMSVPTE